MTGLDDDRFRRAHQVRLVIETPAGPVEVDLAESPLRWLASRRDASGRPFLSPTEVEAGERFRVDFTLAGLSPKLGITWAAPVSGGRAAGVRRAPDLTMPTSSLRRSNASTGPAKPSALISRRC